MTDNWIIAQAFTNPQEAYLARNFMESQGIETMLRDEMTAQVNNFYSNAIGGVKLMVKESDGERALEVLKQGGYIVENTGEQEQQWEWVKKRADRSHCPFCHSENIGRKNQLGLVSVIVYFILGVLFPLFRSEWMCYDCGKSWKYRR